MKEIVDSIVEYFKSRMKTPIYGLFSFWWVVLHWEFFYTLVFVNEKDILTHTGYLKNEYLRMHFMNYSDTAFWWWLLLSFLLSSFFTFLMVWLIPRLILLPAYGQQKSHEFDKRRVKISHEKELERLGTQLQKIETTQIRAAERKSRVIRSASPEVRWERDFRSLVESPLFDDFQKLIDRLYGHGGDMRNFDSDLLAYAEANDLVEFDRDDVRAIPTDKGKYFIKIYQTYPRTTK